MIIIIAKNKKIKKIDPNKIMRNKIKKFYNTVVNSINNGSYKLTHWLQDTL